MKGRLKIGLTVALLALAGCGAWMLVGRHTGGGGAGGGSTIGQSVNAGIDNLVATGVRLLELPVILLLVGGAVLATLLSLPVLRWGTRTGRIKPAGIIVAAIAGVGLLGLALAADHKIVQLQDQVSDLHNQLRQLRMEIPPTSDAVVAPHGPPRIVPLTTSPVALAGAVSHPATTQAGAMPGPAPAANGGVPSKRDAFLFDNQQVRKDLGSLYGTIAFRALIQDQATDIVEVELQKLPAVAFLAIVDLKTPGLQIKFGGSLMQKSLTSEFAKSNGCVVAINGEAGASPMANSGLGTWTGNMISEGKVFLKEDPFDRRPFLSFDRQANVTFTAQTAAQRAVPNNAYNVIWGRLDAIVNGKVQTENERDRQPRTAMGISQDGARLFLLVVDGRQQRYSIGFTRAEVGQFLQIFGAANGMLCDEGGSSCMYVKKFNGIANAPSDGVERPTYTHFGVSLKTN